MGKMGSLNCEPLSFEYPTCLTQAADGEMEKEGSVAGICIGKHCEEIELHGYEADRRRVRKEELS